MTTKLMRYSFKRDHIQFPRLQKIRYLFNLLRFENKIVRCVLRLKKIIRGRVFRKFPLIIERL